MLIPALLKLWYQKINLEEREIEERDIWQIFFLILPIYCTLYNRHKTKHSKESNITRLTNTKLHRGSNNRVKGYIQYSLSLNCWFHYHTLCQFFENTKYSQSEAKFKGNNNLQWVIYFNVFFYHLKLIHTDASTMLSASALTLHPLRSTYSRRSVCNVVAFIGLPSNK